MDGEDPRLRRALAVFGGDVWALADAALAAAVRDRPEDLRARRDGIVERLYAAAGCSNCDGRRPPLAAAAAAAAAAVLEEEEEEQDMGEEASAAVAVSPEAAEADVDADREEDGDDDDAGMESKILVIRDFLEDPEQPEDELVSLLQNLADMDITYKALQATDIGRQVNGLRKHPSAEVRRLVKQLIRKWKEIVDDWVRLHNIGGDGGTAIITDGDSPDKFQGRNHQSPQVSEFKYSPSPQRHNGSNSNSEKANNGFGSTMDVKRKASPAPTYQNSRQINNNHHQSTTSASAPAKMARDSKDSLLDLDRLDSARRRLQENYQEAQNAKKQRTIQVMDINEIPKPKNRNTFIRKAGGGGLPSRHR